MVSLTPAQRRDLRAQAHHLDPVVLIGHHGVTPAVMHEIDLALTKHELVKVRSSSEDRTLRNAAMASICAAMECAAVQHLGRIFVLWRPNPDKAKAKVAPAAASKVVKGTKKPRADARKPAIVKLRGPRAPADPIRERRRQDASDNAPAGDGRGRRGAARGTTPVVEDATTAPPSVRRKSTYTPKTTPKSFSAKPNPRSAWQKTPAVAAPRARRRKTG